MKENKDKHISDIDRKQRVSDIVDRLSSLTLEANLLTHELRELGRTSGDPTHTPNEEEEKKSNPTTNDFEKGEKVVITNGYRGNKGTTGTVTHVTRTQVTFKDNSGKKHVRKFTNVTRVKK
jgi:hypothetical protein